MLRKIHLHGALQKHGEVFELNVMTAGEAVVALSVNIPGFMDDIRQGSWVVLRGDPETGICLDEDAILGMRLGDADLHFMPELSGSKNSNGAFKAVVGAALIAVTAGNALPLLANPIIAGAGSTWGNAIGQLGLAMALTGVSSMLAPETESADDEKSFTMTGPVSAHGQGQAVQIVYGEVVTGGMLISGGIDAAELEIVTDSAPAPTDPNLVPLGT